MRSALAVGVLVAAMVSGAACLHRSPVALPAHPSIERDGLRYEFDALTGRERLWDVADPSRAPRNVLDERRDAARLLRRALEQQLGVDSLDALREAHRAEADELRRLGYL